ncbi:MAG: hypothetical protein P9L94_19405 [Candidatus Hinthialibacter antarcticus]|nr:hypothetical protein [Candidatus Hinthialibacter antarcticus]
MTSRILVPCIIAAALAVVALFALQTAPPADPFPNWLATIESQEASLDAYQEAGRYLAFLGEALNGQSDPDVRRQLADRHFLLGQAMFNHKTPAHLDYANQQFLRAVTIFPSLRHGWPFFLGAEAFERRDQDERAIEWYQQAAQHDYGQLALDARYRIALVEIRQPTPPQIDPRPVYDFLRFVSTDPFNEITTFRGASWGERPEALYLHSLAALRNGDPDAAARMMQGYLRLRPDDPSAAYHLDAMSGWKREGAYPADGNLLRSFIAPRAFDDNGPLLTNNAELFSDAYFHAPPQHVALDIEFIAPNDGTLNWTVCFNGECQTLSLPAREPNRSTLAGKQVIVSAVFNNVLQRNHILIQPTLTQAAQDESQNRVRLLKLTLLEPASTSSDTVETPR